MSLFPVQDVQKRIQEIEAAQRVLEAQIQSFEASKVPVDKNHPTGGFIPDYMFEQAQAMLAKQIELLEKEKRVLKEIVKVDEKMNELKNNKTPQGLFATKAFEELGTQKANLVAKAEAIEADLAAAKASTPAPNGK